MFFLLNPIADPCGQSLTIMEGIRAGGNLPFAALDVPGRRRGRCGSGGR